MGATGTDGLTPTTEVTAAAKAAAPPAAPEQAPAPAPAEIAKPEPEPAQTLAVPVESEVEELAPTPELLYAGEIPKPHPPPDATSVDLAALLDPSQLVTKLRDVTGRVSDTLEAASDQAMGVASDRLRYGASVAASEASKAVNAAQTHVDHGLGLLGHYRGLAVDALWEDSRVVRENPREAAAGALAVAAALTPSVRRGTVRLARRLFLSESSRLAGLERATSSLKTLSAEQASEINKLTERLAHAEREYTRGKTKLEGVAGELDALGARLSHSRTKADGALKELRSIRHGDAVARRSEAAEAASLLKGQEKEVRKLLKQLAVKGF